MKAKTAQQLRKECLKAIQLLARLESADDNGYVSCVCCGVTKQWNDGMHGSHFLPKGGSSYWALEPTNVWPSCASCNVFGMQHGTAAQEFTLWMQDKFGREYVQEMIDRKREVRKYSTADYREMLAGFKAAIDYHKARIGIK